MNRYFRGKIYKIIDNTNSNVYYGSTTETLEVRLRLHKNLNCSSRDIIANGDYDIILIENYPCNSKKELETRERYFIENNQCVNKVIPGRTPKEYYQDNREKKLQYVKEYNINNNEYRRYYKKKLREYKNSLGGDARYNNNLLLIDPFLFRN